MGIISCNRRWYEGARRMPDLTEPYIWNPGGAEYRLPSPLGGEGLGVRACQGQAAVSKAVATGRGRRICRPATVCSRRAPRSADSKRDFDKPSPPAPSPPRGEGRSSTSAYAAARMVGSRLPNSACRPDLTKPDTAALPGTLGGLTDLTEPDTWGPQGACSSRMDLTEPDAWSPPGVRGRPTNLTEPDTWGPPGAWVRRFDLTEPDIWSPPVRQARGGGCSPLIARPRSRARPTTMGGTRG
jgi:hypothetical protein